MINYSDFSAESSEKFTDSDGTVYSLAGRGNMTLADTFALAAKEKILQSLGAKLADGKISEKEIIELEGALNSLVSVAIPTYPVDRIKPLPIALQVAIIQAWQASYAA